jgi:hypothetical protein
MSERRDDDHWLARPATIRLLWIAFIASLVLTVLAGLFVEHHGPFGLENTFGFNAWYGFLSCVALIVLARALGVFLKRRDDYYES